MKLKRLYTNHPDKFDYIEFNSGVNVILAKIEHPKESRKDSHNLGKSLLASVIDFCLLKNIDRHYFLKKNEARFRDWVFFLELELNNGQFLTIRRAVAKHTKIAFFVNEKSQTDLTFLDFEDFHEKPKSLDGARKYLDSMLKLTVLGDYPYRKGVTYFLRGQDDYSSVFQLKKFSDGRHKDWKPFMARLLGFDDRIVREKYDVDDVIGEETGYSSRVAYDSGASEEAYDKIRGLIQIKRDEYAELESQINAFRLHTRDTQLNEELVEQVERETSEVNNRLYVIEFELAQISDALERSISFDLDEIKEIFKESQILFPDQIVASYQEAVAFHKAITVDRNERLRVRAQELKAARSETTKRHEALDSRRRELLSVLQETDWFERFKTEQRQLATIGNDIVRLEAQLETAAQLEEIRETIETLQEKRTHLISQMRAMVKNPPERYERIRGNFRNNFRNIFDVAALLSVQQNSEGNLEFDAVPVSEGLLQVSTSEGDGYSYKKMLCAAFDLALLMSYSDSSFYRFVYHDGVFESLDDRKKLLLLDLVRRVCAEYEIQYMLSLIESDLPRDPSGRRKGFLANEVILSLHDGGDDGRLFKGPKF